MTRNPPIAISLPDRAGGVPSPMRRETDPIARNIREQLDALAPCRTADGRTVLVNPAHVRELERQGLL